MYHPLRSLDYRRAHKAALFTATMLSGFGIATPALSQQAEATNSGGLNDIVVTAQRVEQNLQDVPLSVSALSGGELADRQITRSSDLRGVIPNLVTTKTSTAGATYMNIRGQQSGNLPNISLDPRIGIYLDGVYIARTQGGSFRIADIERLEVLKGPQGTQFGKNVTGGSINFITAGPTGEFGVIAEAGIGNYGRRRFRGTINSPDMGGFSLRFSYVHEQNDGDQRNLVPGRTYGPFVNVASGFTFPIRPSVKSFGGDNTETMFAAARYDGGPFTADLKFDYTSSFERTSGLQNLGWNNSFLGCVSAAMTFGVAADCRFNQSGALAGADPGVNLIVPITSPTTTVAPFGPNKLNNLAQDLSGGSFLKSRGASLTMAYEISDNLTLKSISGYRKLNTNTQVDLDGGSFIVSTDALNTNIIAANAVRAANPAALGGPLPALALFPAGQNLPYCLSCSTQFQSQRQFSQELQLIGNIGTFVDFLAGLYYFRETGLSRNIYVANFNVINPLVPPLLQTTNAFPNAAFGNGDFVNIRSKAKAAFGRVTFHPFEGLDLQLGGRYTQDRKRNIISPVLAALIDDNSTLAGVQPVPVNRSVAFNKFTWDASASYHITEDANIYVRYATAYVAGGLFRNLPFLPETTKAWEAGIKSEWFDRRLRFNAAAFYQKSKNLQLSTGQPVTNTLIVINVGQLKTKGFEAELAAVPFEGLTLTGNIGHTIQKFSDGSRNSAPKWSYQVALTYDTPTFAGDMFATFGVDANYRSRYWGNRFALNSAAGGYNAAYRLPSIVYTSAGFADTPAGRDAYIAALDAAQGLGGYWIVNARVSLNDIPLGPTKAKLSAYARNLTDKRNVAFATNYGTSVGAVFEENRSYGLDVRVEF